MTSASLPGRRVRAASTLALTIALCLAGTSPVTSSAVAAAPGAAPGGDGGDRSAVGSADGGSVAPAGDWLWPVHPFRLERPFVAPPHEYGPGHRGIDLTVLGEEVVRSPAVGVVAFSGRVAGRGILTIDHGGGLVSTLEPVDSDLAVGTPVAAGVDVGRVSTGGHTAPGAVHFGVRLDGAYINPLVLLSGVPRAVLLPCC